MSFNPHRYETMLYRRCGRSGLRLPAVSFGLWQGTGSYVDDAASREIVHTAFDLGITHFDLANNYGNPAGASEELFGRILRGMPRHELVVSSKAGYGMWPGPYGEWGSRKHLIESCEQSLKRLGLDHVDIFYSHRFDPDTPLEETLGALETLVRQGKALYAGISSYADAHFSDALRIVREHDWAPITTEVSRSSLSSQASAICARLWPRAPATSFSAFSLAIRCGVTWADVIPPLPLFNMARESPGMPLRYLFVRRPWASGEKPITPTHSRPAVGNTSRSALRSSIE